MDGEKSDPSMTSGLSPAPHQWQTADQQPHPLSWHDKLMYGRDASGPEISLKPAEILMLKKAQEGMVKLLFLKDQCRSITLYFWYLTGCFVSKLLCHRLKGALMGSLLLTGSKDHSISLSMNQMIRQPCKTQAPINDAQKQIMICGCGCAHLVQRMTLSPLGVREMFLAHTGVSKAGLSVLC